MPLDPTGGSPHASHPLYALAPKAEHPRRQGPPSAGTPVALGTRPSGGVPRAPARRSSASRAWDASAVVPVRSSCLQFAFVGEMPNTIQRTKTGKPPCGGNRFDPARPGRRCAVPFTWPNVSNPCHPRYLPVPPDPRPPNGILGDGRRALGAANDDRALPSSSEGHVAPWQPRAERISLHERGTRARRLATPATCRGRARCQPPIPSRLSASSITRAPQRPWAQLVLASTTPGVEADRPVRR
jgi:hypothetical protein